MTPLYVESNNFRRGGLSAMFLLGVVCSLAACGGSEASGGSSSLSSEGAEAAEPAAGAMSAPLGTGFIMVSALTQLHLTEATFLEESDCTARVSALGDATEYESCLEVPPSAICLQASEGLREADKWWECFVEEAGCEEAIAGHEVVREQGGYVREILLGCTETEMESIFASM